MRFETSVLIDAPVEVVWRLTEDVTAWPTMTPTMTRVVRLDDGPLRVGSQAASSSPASPRPCGRSAGWTRGASSPGRPPGWG